jgi:hypothetical protein
MSSAMRTRGFPVVNVLQVHGLGARRRPSLAQADQNRLLGIPLSQLFFRRQLAFTLDQQGKFVDDPALVAAAGETLSYAYSWLPVPGFTRADSWDRQEFSRLIEVANAPTPEEIVDLDAIDSLFDPVPPPIGEPETNDPLYDILCLNRDPEDNEGGRVAHNKIEYGAKSYLLGLAPRTPFLCTSNSRFSRIRGFSHWDEDPAGYLGVGRGGTWDVPKRAAVLNGATALRILTSYPFPSPISVIPHFWFAHNQAALSDFVNSDVPAGADLVRLWITLTTIETYDSVADAVIRELETQAKKEKRRQIMKAVTYAVAGIIFTAALGGVLASVLPSATATVTASTVTKALQQALGDKERREAAEELEEVARVFEESDAAFAAESRWAAEVIDAAAADEAGRRGLTAEQAEAIEEGRTNPMPSPATHGSYPDYVPQASVTGLLIGGGIAAAGIGLLALLR